MRLYRILFDAQEWYVEAENLAEAAEVWKAALAVEWGDEDVTDEPESIELLHERTGMPAVERRRACRVCGCMQHRACADGGAPCHWVEQDLCSACAPKAKLERIATREPS